MAARRQQRSGGVSRRTMMAAAAGVMIVPSHVLGGEGKTPPSGKLNVAGIGVGGMGFGDLKNVSQTENVVAVCDVDRRTLARAQKEWPGAKPHTDFRRMLEEQNDIDAVVIATPDHLHAHPTMMAMRMGKHVHCQKPLTHSVAEARAVGKLARESKVATQMGNQGQASEAPRVVAELIAAGAIGNVREVHGWSNRRPDISPRGIARPKDTPKAPEWLDWDLWVGPSPMRPYHPSYHPFAWRGWWDFGTGVLGDIGCHQFSAVFKALKLGHPTVVEASSSNWQLSDEIQRETAPVASVTRWEFPADGERGPVTLYWYNGGIKPPRPVELEAGLKFGEDDGILYVGDKGKIFNNRLIPEKRRKEFGQPAKVLERSIGHYKEWTAACKGGKSGGSSFADHAAHLAEVVLLGNVAIRMNDRLEWDGPNMRVTNNEAANALLNPPYREGWSL
jgi:predicted dehydrogenase